MPFKVFRATLGIFFFLTETFGEKQNSFGIDTLFATMSDPPTPNLHFLVQSSLEV